MKRIYCLPHARRRKAAGSTPFPQKREWRGQGATNGRKKIRAILPIYVRAERAALGARAVMGQIAGV